MKTQFNIAIAPPMSLGRRALATRWCLAIFVLITSLIGISVASAAEPGPNIVFILIDDMGWPDMSCYGNEFNETPVIDKFATQGMRFTDFYAATPVCSSTRSTIMTGQYSARTAVTDFIPGHWRPYEKLIVPKIEHQLAASVQTPGDALKAAGYVTGYFGKWHLGGKNQQPRHRGFDITGATISSAFNASRKGRSPGPKRIDLLTDQTLWFIEQNKNKPFFVTLSHYAVHIRLEATDDAIAKYRKKPKPPEGVNNPMYAAMIENLDQSIGRVLGKLDELGLAEKTLVVVTSDNGGLRKIYTGVGDVVSSNTPLRDEKGTLYEGGIRVPMIVRWPGVIKPGSTCAEPATTADLLPTFCAVTGAKLPDQPIDGLSMTPLFKDGGSKLARDAIYFHYPHYHHSRPGSAIRSGDLKLIEFLDDGSLELYNLKDDLGESKNLAAQLPQTAKSLKKKLSDWRTAVGARLPTKNPKYDPKRAHEWWSRRTNKPLDIKAMAERYKAATPRSRKK